MIVGSAVPSGNFVLGLWKTLIKPLRLSEPHEVFCHTFYVANVGWPPSLAPSGE